MEIFNMTIKKESNKCSACGKTVNKPCETVKQAKNCTNLQKQLKKKNGSNESANKKAG